MNSITIDNHASGALVTNSNVTNSGAVTISGSSPTVTISAGTWTQKSHTPVTLNFAGKPVYNFTLANAGTSSTNTETLGGALNMSGALTITTGKLDTSTSNYGMSITGAVDNSSTLRANGSTITVGGNWTTQAAGAFVEGTSTVVLNGANKTLSGSTTFYKLNKTPSVSDTLTFGVGTTTRTTEKLTLTSGAGTLSLRSSTSGQRFNITADGNRVTATGLDVKDSNATVTIACSSCTDSGNNSSGWVFTTAASTTTSGTSGGGGGGGGGRAYLKTSTPAAPTTPAPKKPATTPLKKTVIVPKKVTPKTPAARMEERKKARAEAQARLKERAAQRKAKSKRK